MALSRLRALLHHLNVSRTGTARMSTAIHNTNEACCTRPPVSSDYTPKGSFTSFGGFKKVYVTGPQRGDTVLVCVYDIFGFKPQTQQGADILASQLNVQVLMPDFFEDGSAWLLSQYPPQTDEQKANIQAFFGGIANPVENATRLSDFGHALKDEGVKRVGCYGFCWGGKVIMLAGGKPHTPFDVVSIVHPAMLSAGDAQRLDLPLGLFISKEESEEEFHKTVDVMNRKPFAAKNDDKIYDSFHGFAAARANLDDPDNKEKYTDLYQRLATFLKKNDISA